jgi:pimeloyl-ACP methyl ester carboxylesterase
MKREKMSASPEARNSLPDTGKISVFGAKLELLRCGSGRPILFLHPEAGIDPGAPVFNRLASQANLIAPSHPGFGASDLLDGMSNIDDLAYYYLDFLEAFNLRDVTIVGVSFGGWIAAEMAIKSTARISRLVLANAVGIKAGNRETRDIADIFALTEAQLAEHSFHDPAAGLRNFETLPDDILRNIARNREATARFGWVPYMHDPKLKGRLHRIDVPTLLLWGESDQIVKPDYGRAYCAAIPGARFDLIERAGHAPHIEQPDIFAGKVIDFMNEGGPIQQNHIRSREIA